MEMRRFLTVLLIAGFAVVIPGSVPRAADAQEKVTLRIATLAPQGSAWMRVFNAWNTSLKKETDGKVEIRFYAGGVSGDERDFIRKMRAGQLDGAAVTSTGLGMVVRPMLVLQAPGVFNDYETIDRVREALAPEIEGQFRTNGYELLGWGDVGRSRLFSKKPILKPSDLKGVRPWVWKDDSVAPAMMKKIGANGVPLGVPEVYPALQTGMVDTLFSSALAAVSLQWYSKLTHVSKEARSVVIGATILRKDKVDALTDEQRKVLFDTAQRAHNALRGTIRADDEKAYRTILGRGLTEFDNSQFKAEWTKIENDTRAELAGRLYPRDLLEKVEKMAKAGGK